MRLPKLIHNAWEDIAFPFRRAATNRREARLERLVMAALDTVPDDDVDAQEAAIRAVYGMPPDHPEMVTGQLDHEDEAVVNAYEDDLLSGTEAPEPARETPGGAR